MALTALRRQIPWSIDPPGVADAPAHLGSAHAVADSILSIAIGVAVVAVYVAFLHWLTDGGRSNDRDRDRGRTGS